MDLVGRSKKCVFLTLFNICVLYIITQTTSTLNWSYRDILPFMTVNNKSILLWNSPHRIETSSFGFGREAFVLNNCSVTQCEIFTNRSALPFEQYDAVVMNMHEIHLTTMPEDEKFQRSQHQRYIFLTQESPQTMPMNPETFLDYFNWTMTFRLDSDIPFLYGRITPKPSAPKDATYVDQMIRETHNWTKNYATGKNKTVVWMVSHCDTHSLRETYVQELKKFIDVDVYGGCGNMSCARNHTHWLSEPQCYDMLARNYKFYLSFENSVCTDYVTEKFFNILTKDLVPVVYGGANYSSLAPAHSFIDAMQFTPRQLAQHLSHLAANDTLYNEFFWWKEHYEVEAGVEQMARHGFCDLCKKLHQDSTEKVYEKIKFDWSWIAQCKQMASWLTGS